MNYIGSKYSLLPDIERVLDTSSVPSSGIALDLFAGTGVVAQFLKKRGYITYANDWQRYSQLACVAYLEHNALPQFSRLIDDGQWGSEIADCPVVPRSLPVCSIAPATPAVYDSAAARVLAYLSRSPGSPGAFYDAYCEGGTAGRQYFSEENGLRIQAVRDQVEAWSRDQLISSREEAWLVASLLEGADRVANTASVYGAYLKHIKRSAQKPLQLCLLVPAPSIHQSEDHRAFCLDGEHLLRELQRTRLRLVYLDPPYNSRQYNANYHILETIARWDLDQFEPRGVTGLRGAAENRSRYCLKTQVLTGFRSLLSLMNADYVLFSYSDEGLVSRQELDGLFRDHCDTVRFEEIAYRRFRADSDGEDRVYKGDSTTEYLILGKMKDQIDP